MCRACVATWHPSGGVAGCHGHKSLALPQAHAIHRLQGVRSYLAVGGGAARGLQATGPAPDEVWLEGYDGTGPRHLPVMTPFLAYEASGGNFSWL